MLCIDDVRTVALPPSLPATAFDSANSAKLENESYLVEVSRSNGSITRIRDKKKGWN